MHPDLLFSEEFFMLGAIANWAAAMVLAVAILDFAMLVPAHAAAWTE